MTLSSVTLFSSDGFEAELPSNPAALLQAQGFLWSPSWLYFYPELFHKRFVLSSFSLQGSSVSHVLNLSLLGFTFFQICVPLYLVCISPNVRMDEVALNTKLLETILS